MAEYYHTFKENRESLREGTRFPYAASVFDEKEMQALMDEVLDFGLTTGRFSEQFEKAFADWIGAKYAQLVKSGSSAILTAFMDLTASELGKDRFRYVMKGLRLYAVFQLFIPIFIIAWFQCLVMRRSLGTILMPVSLKALWAARPKRL